MFNKFNFDAATPESLADRLGELEARKAAIAGEIDATKKAILESGINKADGKRYAFTVLSPSTRESFSASKAKAFLTSAQIAACTSTIDVKASVRIRARKA
jgi:hypothetical protein